MRHEQTDLMKGTAISDLPIHYEYRTISQFKGMSPPVVCPTFLELKVVYGCPYDCEYCYLKGTLAFLSKHGEVPVMPLKNYIKRLQLASRDLEKFFKVVKKPCLLNAGELGEPLMFENTDLPLSLWLMRAFAKNTVGHKVLILTKSNSIGKITRTLEKIKVHDKDFGDPDKYLVMAFSLTTNYTNKHYEGAPCPAKRLEAAYELQRLGIPVRIRIDPILPLPNVEEAKQDIRNLVATMATKLALKRIDRITLGTPRINNPRLWRLGFWKSDMKQFMHPITLNDGKRIWRIQRDIRHTLYETALTALWDNGYRNAFALCKETESLWKTLKLDPNHPNCNCVI